jgi:hypothetical protein
MGKNDFVLVLGIYFWLQRDMGHLANYSLKSSTDGRSVVFGASSTWAVFVVTQRHPPPLPLLFPPSTPFLCPPYSIPSILGLLTGVKDTPTHILTAPTLVALDDVL